MVNNVGSLSAPVWNTATSNTKNSPEKIKGVAQQFEALMIQQLLKTSRDEGSGWMGTDANDPGQTSLEMAEQQIAMVMSKSGGLGLTKTIVEGLQKSGTDQ
jgi:flagellar protein FlgJ